MLRVCYSWEMGLMVKTAELQRVREQRERELARRREEFCARYNISEADRAELSKLKPPVQTESGRTECK